MAPQIPLVYEDLESFPEDNLRREFLAASLRDPIADAPPSGMCCPSRSRSKPCQASGWARLCLPARDRFERAECGRARCRLHCAGSSGHAWRQSHHWLPALLQCYEPELPPRSRPEADLCPLSTSGILDRRPRCERDRTVQRSFEGVYRISSRSIATCRRRLYDLVLSFEEIFR